MSDILTGSIAGTAEGITLIRLKDGKLTKICSGGYENCSFIISAGKGLYLTSVETDRIGDTEGGGVLSFALKNGEISCVSLLNALAKGICHVSFAPGKRLVFASSYSEGCLEVLELKEDGSLRFLRRLQESGCGPHPDQTVPRVHSSCINRREDRLYVCNLGADTVTVYDTENFTIRKVIPFPPGTGPRHMLLSGDEKKLYIACELSNEVFAVDTESGAILQQFSCQAESFTALSSIRYTKDGSKLIVGSRGHDGFQTFRISADGTLEQQAFTALPGAFIWDVYPLEGGVLAACFQEDGILYEKEEKFVRLTLKKPTCFCSVK